ncbi:hypothetical protein J3R74_000276 [Puniceicoccus vermicola]
MSTRDWRPISDFIRSKIDRELDKWEAKTGERPEFGLDERRAAVATLASRWSKKNAAILTRRHLDKDHPDDMPSTDSETLVRFISRYPEFALGDGKQSGFLTKFRGWLLRLDEFHFAESRGETLQVSSEDVLGIIKGLGVCGDTIKHRRQRSGQKPENKSP